MDVADRAERVPRLKTVWREYAKQRVSPIAAENNVDPMDAEDPVEHVEQAPFATATANVKRRRRRTGAIWLRHTSTQSEVHMTDFPVLHRVLLSPAKQPTRLQDANSAH